jgi:transcriptional regulator of acetoin/glycerol metabolism
VPSESGETGAALEGLGERQKILDTLNRHQWHRGKTAEQLAVDRTTLWRKMKKYNIHP